MGLVSNDYEGIHSGFGYGSKNQESERNLELGAALNMCACNTIFKKWDIRLVKYVFGTVRTQIDYMTGQKKRQEICQKM